MNNKVEPTGIENTFAENEIIVTKTDLKGRIIYANDIFCRVAEISEEDALGAPHSIIRHPDMPRAVFWLLWQQIEAGNEIFAFVKNMATSGNHYWVFAHVTPTVGTDGDITGYHSSRRAARPSEIKIASALYAKMCEIEQSYDNRKEGMEAGIAYLINLLDEKGLTYDQFVWSLCED